MSRKGNIQPLPVTSSEYQEPIKQSLIERFGYGVESPEELSHIPDGWYAVTVNEEMLRVHLRGGRIAGIGLVEVRGPLTLPHPRQNHTR